MSNDIKIVKVLDISQIENLILEMSIYRSNNDINYKDIRINIHEDGKISITNISKILKEKT